VKEKLTTKVHAFKRIFKKGKTFKQEAI
jgi:hypothetical protein